MSYKYLLDIAIILLATKLLGMLTRSSSCPRWWVRCWLVLILGPALLGVIEGGELLNPAVRRGGHRHSCSPPEWGPTSRS